MFSILFVCTGNTCRSPMAEALMRSLLPAGSRDIVGVASAGAMAAAGMPATPYTLKVLSQRGIDLQGHRSRRLNREMVAEADLILVMEEEHRRAVLSVAREAGEKTFVLSEFESESPRGERSAVHDPIGGSMEIYEETCRRIEEHLNRALPVILDRVGAK